MVRKRQIEWELKSKHKIKHSPESKKNISEKRKKWLSENPDKHPWRNKDKFKSIPCEKAKKFLTKLEIEFVEEFQPEIKGRNFSIDIAMPDKMIALEINGNQHYERSGELKPYYQKRNDLLESSGWDVYQIHYSACFNLEKWSEFINKIKESKTKIAFNYFNYKPKTKSKKKRISDSDPNWRHRPRPERRKVQRPPHKTLIKEITSLGFSATGRKYGVSDNAIRKWIEAYENL